MTDENEETFEFIIDEDNKYEMTIDDAIEMHKAMDKGANKLLSQIAVHSFMVNMRDELEETEKEGHPLDKFTGLLTFDLK